MSARVTLSTGSLYGFPLERSFATAAALGLDGVELLLTDRWLAAGPAAAAALSQRHAIPILSVHFPVLGRTDDADLHAAYERTAAYAAALPTCEAVVVHTPVVATLHGPAGQAYLRALRRCQERLRGARARVAIENRGVGQAPPRPGPLDDLAGLRRLVEEWDLALTYDVGHAASWGLDTVRALDTLGPRVVNIHLSDSRLRSWPWSAPGLRSHFRDHQPLGAGRLPIADLLGQVAARSYGGLVTLELSPLALHLPAPWRAGARLAESVARCRAGLAVAIRSHP